MDKKVRSRSLAIGLFFTLFFLALIGRLYWVQIVDRGWLMEKAEAKWRESEEIAAKRGTISDRNGKALAEDGRGYIVTLNPQVLVNKGLEKDAAEGLAPILASSDDPAQITKLETKLYEMATRKKKDSDDLLVQVEVQTEGYNIDGETKEKIDGLIGELQEKIKLRNEQTTGKKLDTKDVGISTIEISKRYYPYNRLASQVLGFLDKWGEPAGYGLEASLDDLLKGTPGKLERERDLKGVELPNGKVSYTAPVDGKNVTLTIDQTIQYYVENALRQVYEEWKPRGVIGVAADPKTGEILAMANIPDYNPNKYWEASSDISVFENKAVSYTYEPGSTFKLVTLAGAIEENLFNPTDKYESGSIKVDDRTLSDHNNRGWGTITYMEGLLRSSNVAFVKLGLEKLGQDKLTQYIQKFGFGERTGIDLPNEKPGVVQMKWRPEYATATYGQGRLTVTAVQQLAAYGAAANGGKLMKPYIIKEIVDPNTNEIVQANSPQVVRQVVSEETAKQVTLDLEQVISNKTLPATGWRAYIDGYRAAGKTGTAQIVMPGEKKYSSDKYLITFAGYAPVEDPKFVLVLIADVPELEGDSTRAGEVLSPAFKEIVSQSLSYLGVTSKATADQMSRIETTVTVPDTVGMEVSSAQTVLSQAGLQPEIIGDGENVLKQLPLSGVKVPGTQRVYLMTEEGETADVPNLVGKSLRDALEVCSLLGIKSKAIGEGYVVSQELSGDELNRELTLTLQPPEGAAEQGETNEPESTPTPTSASLASPTPGASLRPSPSPAP